MVLRSWASRSARRLLKDLKPAFVGAGERDCEALGIEIIAGVTSRDFYLVGLAAQTNDIVRQNDFSFCHKKVIRET